MMGQGMDIALNGFYQSLTLSDIKEGGAHDGVGRQILPEAGTDCANVAVGAAHLCTGVNHVSFESIECFELPTMHQSPRLQITDY